ncbi:metal-dependent hydrolase [Flexistipes sinusarabici]|uniref:metal-dependent hydrolase n=1 Tax=Flexistipes sinusarabici TaxID=2352 RepID=UPI0023538A3E
MDPVTHFTSGVVLSKSLGFKAKTKSVVLFGSLALLPDIDNVISFFGTKADYLLYHRGFTHSVWGGLILGILAAFLLKYIFKKSFLFSLITGASIMYTHIYLDYITSYGTQLLAPFSRHRFALSSVFIIDPFYTLTLITLLIFALILRSRKTAIIAAAFLLFYPVTNLGVKSFVKSKVSKLTDNKVIVTTTAFTPLYWKVIIEGKDTYKVKDVKTYQKIDPAAFKSYRKFNKECSVYNFSTKFLKTYLWFVDYPVIVKAGGKYDFEIFDLKFMLNKDIFGKHNHKAFTLQFKTNSKGELTEHSFN